MTTHVTWDLTLETLITFLTIENNNMNNDIVTFEYRVMVTAFAILAMFLIYTARSPSSSISEGNDHLNLQGSCFSEDFGGSCFGTPRECIECKEECRKGNLKPANIRIVIREKNGIMWEKFPNLGGGPTQTHFLMSTYQVIFGMPKWFWGAKTCFTKRGEVISDQF